MATKLSGSIQVTGTPLFSSGGDTDAQHVVGSGVESNDGRRFRYVYCTPTALIAGTLLQGQAEITNHQNLTSPVAAIGDTSLAVTLGATAVEPNFYAGGLMVITVTPGVGYSYRIKSHPGAASAASLTITLDDPLEVALTATSRIDLVANPYNGVIIYPTTTTGPAVGVATDIISAGRYGWVQTKGPVACLASGTVLVGQNVIASRGAAGAIGPWVAGTQVNVGYAITGIADTEYGAIVLQLD